MRAFGLTLGSAALLEPVEGSAKSDVEATASIVAIQVSARNLFRAIAFRFRGIPLDCSAYDVFKAWSLQAKRAVCRAGREVAGDHPIEV